MIFALLLLIVAILLFGAGVVRGFLANAAGIVIGFFVILLAVGYVKAAYDKNQAEKKLAALIPEARQMTVKIVAERAGKPVADLMDLKTVENTEKFAVCGTIRGTKGFGGPDGRQRFYSNGGGITEIEPVGSIESFLMRQDTYCSAF